jgi:glycosyltransferase involved in cell wall biosynthesis
MKNLTIAITTFNRRERLLKQLHSIYNQAESSQISILIRDNHSDYDVLEAIHNEFGTEITSNLRVVVNELNVGMHANLAMVFWGCETDWIWTLSDDDELFQGSIKTVLNHISMAPKDTVMLKYGSMIDLLTPTTISSLPELIDYFLINGYHTGILIFLSNNVHNMHYVRRYYNNTLSYCNCAFAHILPMMYALDNKAGKVLIKSDELIGVKEAEAGNHWNYLKIATDMSTITLQQFNLSNKYYYRLGFLFMRNFGHYGIIYHCLSESDKGRGRFLYNNIYNNSYRHSGFLLDKLYYILFKFLFFTRIPPVPFSKALMIRDKIRKVIPSLR